MSELFEMHRSLGAGVTMAYAASISATVVLGAILQRARVGGGPAAGRPAIPPMERFRA